MSWGNSTSSVHVENGSAATARRPRLDSSARLEIEVATVVTAKVDGIVGPLRVAGEGEGVGALSIGTLGDLSKSNHVSVKNGEPVYW